MAGLRILHTADVHLGAPFRFLGPRGADHRRQLTATFSKVVDLAVTAQVDLFLVAGDLFDSPFPARGPVGEVLYQLERLESQGIWTVMVPGTHDRLEPGGVYDDEAFASLSRFHLFREREMTPLVLDGLDAVIYGRRTEEQRGDALRGLRAAEGAKWRLGLLHASVLVPGRVEKDELVVSRESIARSGLHYLALGHWHTAADFSSGGVVAWYCGSPEVLDMRGEGPGKALLVELREGEAAEVKPVVVGRRRFARKVVEGWEVGNPDVLFALLRREADVDLALEVVVKGLEGREWSTLDWEDMEEELSPLFFHLRLRPEDVSPGEAASVYAENTVAGRFFALARREMETTDEQTGRVAGEALRIGLRYLEGMETSP
jgi:DNA repair exonuclease SbcCD nuclease subunit